MASAMINKIVHGTMVTLKAEASGSGGVAFVEAARRFFSLDEGSSGNERTEDRRSSAGNDLSSSESNSEEAPRRREPRVRTGATGRIGDRGDDPFESDEDL